LELNILRSAVLQTTAKSETLWRQSFRKLQKNRLAMGSLAFLMTILLFSFIGPFFSPYRADTVQVSIIYQSPSVRHFLGTDNLGRDVLTRLMMAGRISLTIGITSMVVSILLGALIGAFASFYGGAMDSVIMRFSDIIMSIPELPLLMIIGAILSEWKVTGDIRIYIVMLMISLVGWPKLARLIRGQMMSLKEQPYMQAAEVLGLNDRHKILYHLIPNAIPLLIVVATLNIADAILSESVLSFLGIGVIPPTPSWGNMISAANNIIDFQRRPWLWISPGCAIFLTVIAINVLGDGLRDALDPKHRGR
jgi:peptide/nickel transport system permease protein